MPEKSLYKCRWCRDGGLNEVYHDTEWGVPLWDDRGQFEFISLEVMQCGLSWTLMLKKREIFRKCFADFDYDRVASFTEADVERILQTEGMIRSRRKVEAIIGNARAFREIRREFGSFSAYLWAYTGGRSVVYTRHQRGEWRDHNGLSDAISRDLRRRGFKFLGSVTVYAHLQAAGIVNDHEPECFRYEELCRLGNARLEEEEI